MTALAVLHAVLARVSGAILAVCKLLVIALTAGIALIIFVGVFWRYALGDALGWYEEVSKFMMLWLAFLGAPLVFKHGGHVAIEALPNALSGRPRAALFVVVHALVIVLNAVLAYQGWLLAWNARTQVALTVGDMSMIWVYLAMPVGCALMAVVSLELILESVIRLVRPEALPEPLPALAQPTFLQS